MNKVNLWEKFAWFSEHRSPKIVGELKVQHVKLVQFHGEFVWHKHDREHQLFLAVQDRFRMDYRDRQVWVEEGEFLIVPSDLEHRPVAESDLLPNWEHKGYSLYGTDDVTNRACKGLVPGVASPENTDSASVSSSSLPSNGQDADADCRPGLQHVPSQ